MHKEKINPGPIVIIEADRNERFRTIKGQIIYNSIDGVNPDEWEVIGHGQGSRVNYKMNLKKEHFDQIQFICVSYNDKDKKKERPFVHAIGSRFKENTQTFLILQQFRREIKKNVLN